MGDFCMPSLGADMETGKLVEWVVVPGQRVRRGDIVALVETQKGLFEIEIFADGIMGEPLVQAGQTVPVGTVLAHFQSDQESSRTDEDLIIPPPPVEQQPSVPEASSEVLPPTPQVKPVLGRIACSPSARRLAMELGVDLANVQGTGPNGAIRREDIEQAAQHQKIEQEDDAPGRGLPPETTADETPGSAMRRAIAAAVSRSNQDIPHYYLETDIDMSRPLQWLEEENRKRSMRERILPVVLLLKAVAKALHDVPDLNGFWQEDRLQPKTDIHIGFAVALRDGGLIAPAIHHVGTRNLDDLMQAMADLIERTRAGRLRSSEMTDSTITVTNLGDRGVKTVFGVIYPPQVALVGLGRISERPWAENGMLGARRCLTATLAADHRATDGHKGALFLDAFNRHLQHPEAL
ncbi:dihydrolipoamide acetyltransferase family protein [Desulfobulbus alkaliphilus]|uniref:dihydrolipoamide acetyltransferase family protein n=1 Tax=Desulfobulbus alkaliphilus TaxID=869814 RepID=UPI0019637814|nr:dihydrolipoamide acetyltransferase family protein [Desulfobulbus alkaliphilus]MBM9537560.1 2-oxo acid dehydrogenase subunit E2 [Desulfobulbus alkaliphilus]